METSPSELYLLLGRLLFRSGATTQRIVDSIACASLILGDKEPPHVLVDYDAIILETRSGGPGGSIRMDQAKGFAGVDVMVLSSISKLLTSSPPGSMSPAKLKAELDAIAAKDPHYSLFTLSLAVVFACIGFDLLNGADLLSLIPAIPAAVTVYLVRKRMMSHSFNLYAGTLLGVIAGGLLASLLARYTGTNTPRIAFIAPMLFLVPGIPMINGGIDMLRNHNATGISRVAFTGIMVSMITLGLIVAMALAPLPTQGISGEGQAVHSSLGWLPLDTMSRKMLYEGLLGGLAAAGLAMLNNAHRKLLLAFALCGVLARALRACGVEYGMDIVSATLVATVLSTIVASFVARRYSTPPYLMSVVAVLSMVPGFFAIEGLNGFLGIAAGQSSLELLSGTMQHFLKAVFISVALILGVIIPTLLLDKDSPKV